MNHQSVQRMLRRHAPLRVHFQKHFAVQEGGVKIRPERESIFLKGRL
jgi:hypothetical protein